MDSVLNNAFASGAQLQPRGRGANYFKGLQVCFTLHKDETCRPEFHGLDYYRKNRRILENPLHSTRTFLSVIPKLSVIYLGEIKGNLTIWLKITIESSKIKVWRAQLASLQSTIISAYLLIRYYRIQLWYNRRYYRIQLWYNQIQCCIGVNIFLIFYPRSGSKPHESLVFKTCRIQTLEHIAYRNELQNLPEFTNHKQQLANLSV